MPNLYVSLGTLKAEIGKSGTSDDAVLLRMLERASREIDSSPYLDDHRPHFFSEIDTRLFDGDGTELVVIDDLLTASSIKADADGDGTYELTLAVDTDYWLRPDNPRQYEPYTHLELNPASGVLTRFPVGRRRIQIIGTFGFSAETEPSGTLGAAVSDTSGTSVTMTAGHGLTGGETIIIGTEQMFVSVVATNALTVVRGVNGSTATTHLNGAAAARRRYHRLVEQACVIRATDIWRGTQTGYGQVATGELGGYQSNTSYAQFVGLLREVSRMPVVVI